jgi:CxxC motif-containing protein (DUF1111 family)
MRSKTFWYVAASVAALVPVGIRLVTIHRDQPTPVDPVMAKAGEELFSHEWTANDPLAGGDGLGPAFNANSCVFCHSQSGPGGGGAIEANVTTFAVRSGPNMDQVREGVVHKYGESLQDVGAGLPAKSAAEITPDMLPRGTGRPLAANALRLPRGVRISQLNTPALFGTKLIDDLSDKDIIAVESAERLRFAMAPAGGTDYPVGRATRTASGKVGRFGWKAQTATLGAFVRAACANELGLGNPSQAQPVPLSNPSYMAPGLDLTEKQCEQLTAFVASLPRPTEKTPNDPNVAAQASAGKKLFASVGCADCHVPDVGNVQGLYSDLLLHHMGADLEGGGSYYDTPLPPPPPAATDPSPEGPATPAEWRTPPLWGVADSAPYMHDGRAATLEEAISLHTGQGAASAARFAKLSPAEQIQLVAFLQTLKAPPDTRAAAAIAPDRQ